MRCEQCQVDVAGSPARCPLCQGDLSGTPEDSAGSVFPSAPLLLQSGRFGLRLAAFLTAVACVICIVINLSYPTGWWCLFVIAGALSFWAAVGLAVWKRKNIPKAIVWQVLLISGLVLLWDAFTGFHGWSLDFVIPILLTITLLALALAARILRLSPNDYLIYLLIDILVGLLSLVLLLCGLVSVPIPTAICVGASAISLAALLFFQGRTLLSELQRRMHI